MKIQIVSFMVFFSSVLFAQVSSFQAIYNQIPAIPDILLCETADNYNETQNQVNILLSQIEEMKLKLNEEIKINEQKSDIIIQSFFPTDEELKRIEKLSEEEQQAFWEKIEAQQIEIENSISNNSLKYQIEKDSLNQQFAIYREEQIIILEEFSEIHSATMKQTSDKIQNIDETCMGADNRLTEYGKQQIDKIWIEHCEIVSTAYIKRLKFEYLWLKQNIYNNNRLTAIKFMECSTLNEKEVYEQHSQLFDLTELSLIEQFISNYKDLLSFLPSDLDDKI
jgi:hypothetical protein